MLFSDYQTATGVKNKWIQVYLSTSIRTLCGVDSQPPELHLIQALYLWVMQFLLPSRHSPSESESAGRPEYIFSAG